MPKPTLIVTGRRIDTRSVDPTPTIPPATPNPTPWGGQAPVLTNDQVGPTSVTSQRSSEAHHSTIFERFELTAEPVYNFYTADELVEFSSTSGSLEDVPRYVRLKWKAAPDPQRSLELPTKGRKTPGRIKPIVFDRSGFPFSADQAVDFDLAARSIANGFVSPGSVRARIEPPVSRRAPTRAFDEELHLISDSSIGIKASDSRSNFSVDQSLVPIESTRRVPSDSGRTSTVTFVDPGVAGAFSEDRASVTGDPQHMTSLMSLSQLASNLEIIAEFNQVDGKRVPAPEFPAPADFYGVSYIGYLIEKHVVHPDGSMSLQEVITISDVSLTEYVDLKVLFGTSYAYRIRSVVRWTRERGIGFEGTSKTDLVAENLSTTGPASHVCSFYAGDWSLWQNTQIRDLQKPEPPDEIHVRPLSRKGEVHITWKIPDDSQRDLLTFTLYRKIRRAGLDASSWEELATYPARNGIHIDRTVGFVEDDPDVDYVYAMQSRTTHDETSKLSTQLAVVLTRNYETLGEELVRFVSHPGVPLDAHGQLATIPPKVEPEVLNPMKRIRIGTRQGVSTMPLFIRDYVIRITSELTGERTDVPLRVESVEVSSRRARSIASVKSVSGRNRRS